MASVLNFQLIKKRPVLTGSIIIGGGLLFYFLFLRGGGSQSSSGAQMGYGDSQVVAASNISDAQMALMGQGQQLQAQLAAAQIQAGNSLAIAQVQADAQTEMAAYALQAATLEQATQLAGIAAQRDVQLTGLQTSAQIEQLRIESQLVAIQDQNAKEVALQTLMAATQQNISQIAANVQIAGIGAQERMSRDTINAAAAVQKWGFATQIALGEQAVETRRIDADMNKYIIGKQMGAQKSNSMWGAIGGIAMGAMMMFSDIEIKTINGCVNSNACLDAINKMPVDVWRYIEGEGDGSETQHVGTYAQDFYRELGCKDWQDRKTIAVVDYFGATTGAIQALSRKVQ